MMIDIVSHGSEATVPSTVWIGSVMKLTCFTMESLPAKTLWLFTAHLGIFASIMIHSRLNRII